MARGFTTPPEKLRVAGKRFRTCATDIHNAMECVTSASDGGFFDSTWTSHGDQSLLDPVGAGWENAVNEIQKVMALMYEVVDKTGLALGEIATRYEEQG